MADQWPAKAPAKYGDARDDGQIWLSQEEIDEALRKWLVLPPPKSDPALVDREDES